MVRMMNFDCLILGYTTTLIMIDLTIFDIIEKAKTNIFRKQKSKTSSEAKECFKHHHVHKSSCREP